MSRRNTIFRAMHDLGAAGWFGGTLMGAVGVNHAASTVEDTTERSRVASAGWGRWAPVNAIAIGSHLIGGAAILIANRDRVTNQAGVGANTTAKLVVTGVALAATAYSGVLGAKVASAGPVPAHGATSPAPSTPPDVAAAQNRLTQLQWAIPALTAVIIVLGAQQGEQQRPSQILRGRLLSGLSSLADAAT